MPITEVPTIGGAVKEHFLVTGVAEDHITATITHVEITGEDIGTIERDTIYARRSLPRYDRDAVFVGQIGCRVAVAIGVDQAREITSKITFEPEDLLYFIQQAFLDAWVHGSLMSRH